MESIRKWFYRPKKDDTSLLAQFFYADESLNAVACELDSFDGRQEPERCTSLVNQLRHCQDKVLTICNQIMDELIPESRANRDFRVKFPDDVMQENLAGQLWFGAECLAAGSSIMNREAESSAMRPLAKALTKSLEIVRNLLREQALKGHMNLKAQNPLEPSLEKLIESLKIFDRLFADFELCYVGAMVPVKSTKEYEQQELVCVLFSETLQRALEAGLLSQADVDNYEPALMFTIPRLAIVSGLLAPPGGPLCLNSPDNISEMFRPFRTLLVKIRELLWTLNNHELYMLEKLLCSNEEPSSSLSQSNSRCQDVPDLEEFVHNFYTGYPNCKDFIADFYTVTRNNGSNMDEVANDAVQDLDRSLQQKDTSPDSESPGASSPNIDAEINRVLSRSVDSVVLTQTQYLLNQVSHENNAIAEREIHIEDSLPDLDSKKLISQANRTLSHLLLDGDQNEISEQTDSGICTVISSENTSLYDKSPEERKTFGNELQGEQENTSYSCSNVNSPRRTDSSVSEGSCVCSAKSAKSQKTSGISSNLNGSSEEFVGVAYGNGQIAVCDGNQGSLHRGVCYSENWETLIESGNSHKEFWGDLKCENCPSTSRVEAIGRIEGLTQKKRQKKVKEEKHRKRYQRKTERRSNKTGEETRRPVPYCVPSTESSRSNSTDRCLNARLSSFGASLHPSQNTRQMPNFGSHSPHASPRLQHFEIRNPGTTAARRPNGLNQRLHRNYSPQNKKLLDHRRSRSEHIAKMKRKDSDKRHDKTTNGVKSRKTNARSNQDLMNDGLGPRTDKSGIVTTDGATAEQCHTGFSVTILDADSSLSDSSSETSEFQSDCQDDEEIALAMQAAEIANRNQIRAKFRSSEDLVHRLFVCIAGVADQLQTNFASDLRNILKCVFLMNSSQPVEEEETSKSSGESNSSVPAELDDGSPEPAEIDNQFDQPNIQTDEDHNEDENQQTIIEERNSPETERGEECVERAPAWIPDTDAPRCMACQAGFTVVRRRHHCRNCGKVFCGRCSSNNVPLPRYGHTKPVRVCNRCFLYQVTPFTVSQLPQTTS